ncbi:subclass B3 metallo-beta-lactamase [Sphingomonas gellani]|nr:subclass B3 metallo-beta-lactamase [Sphingomonas gellani]
MALGIVATGTEAADPPAWAQPTPAFHVAGPIWYVGTKGLASYLIKTPSGAVLIDGTLAQNVVAILANLNRVGVRPRQVRQLLLTHAHFDHAAGLAGLERATGAPLAVGARDAEAVRTGTPPGETDYGVIRFPPARVARAMSDGDVVRLGGLTLTAVATPGHTPGCTSWATRIVDQGRAHDVIFLCSLSVAGNRLVGNRRYPGIVNDYRETFRRLGRVHADIVLPAHPELADVLERGRRAAAGGRDAFVDPTLLQRMVSEARVDFEKELVRQQRATRR